MLLGVGFLVLRDGGAEHATLGARPPAAVTNRDAAAVSLVERLERALQRRDASQAARLAVPGDRAARRELRQLVGVLDRLDVDVLGLRYVGESSSAPETLAAEGRAARWSADLELTWRLPGVDDGRSTLEVPVLLAGDGADVSFVSARDATVSRAPVWWRERVVTARRVAGLALVSAVPDRGLPALLRRSRTVVEDGVPDWDGSALVAVPGSVAGFAAATGLSLAQARGLAGVTTSSDGSASGNAADLVVLNPDVFLPLSTQARRIVLSHELSHVALDAAGTSMPLWLSEGYADYLAFRTESLPAEQVARQAVRLVRRDGPPASLPGEDELDGASPDVGAAYESAWVAVDLLVQQYGEPAVRRFYDTADADGGTDRAFAQLGTTSRAFVRAWQDRLRELAG